MGVKGSFTAANKQRAYDLYAECGGNLSETQRALHAEGLPISYPTLSRWAKDLRYEERLAAADAERQRRLRQLGDIDTTLLTELNNRRLVYKAYLDGLPLGAVDIKAERAHLSIVEMMIKVAAGRVESKQGETPEERQERIRMTIEAEYGIGK